MADNRSFNRSEMPESRVNILSTRPVDETLIRQAASKGIQLDTFSFIETHPVQNVEVQQEIEWAGTEEAIVVFTSMNAVDAVTEMLDEHVPEWRIYCMGHATQKRVAEYFGENAIYGTADNASELADVLLENEEPDEVIFFCGNQRRDELPVKLRSKQVDVSEIIVYETTAIHHKLKKTYDGILFFSPSAVESFFSNNTLTGQTIVFAIGRTTQKTLKSFCKNKIVVSDTPGKEMLVEQAIAYFSEW